MKCDLCVSFVLDWELVLLTLLSLSIDYYCVISISVWMLYYILLYLLYCDIVLLEHVLINYVN